MNDFNALQNSIKEAMANQETPDQKKELSKRQIHSLFIKNKRAKKVAKLSRRKNRK
jgi:hypothetical protein